MRRTMDNYMEENRNMPDDELSKLAREFDRTLNIVASVFGDGTFRRWSPEKGVWRRQVIASLFDAQMFASQYF
jgi:hypothetical protein